MSTAILIGMNQGTIGDVADQHKVSRQRADQWTKEHPDFPKPLRTSRVGNVYDLDRVRAWATKHGVGKS